LRNFSQILELNAKLSSTGKRGAGLYLLTYLIFMTSASFYQTCNIHVETKAYFRKSVNLDVVYRYVKLLKLSPEPWIKTSVNICQNKNKLIKQCLFFSGFTNTVQCDY